MVALRRRDASNNLTGAIDLTDWTADDTWNKQEQQLFSVPFDLNIPLTFIPHPFTSRIQARGFFPNPTTSKYGGSFGFYNIPQNAVRQLIIVDKNYKVLERYQFPSYPSNADSLLEFDLPADKFVPNTIYRMYYIVYLTSPAALYLKGHGNIKLN